MPPHGNETSLQLRVVIATLRIFQGKDFWEIEQQTGVLANTAEKIIRRAVDRAGSNDFHDILACLGDADRSGPSPRIPDQSDLSKQIRQTILKHPELSRTEAVDQENIDIPRPNKKRLRDQEKSSGVVRELH